MPSFAILTAISGFAPSGNWCFSGNDCAPSLKVVSNPVISTDALIILLLKLKFRLRLKPKFMILAVLVRLYAQASTVVKHSRGRLRRSCRSCLSLNFRNSLSCLLNLDSIASNFFFVSLAKLLIRETGPSNLLSILCSRFIKSAFVTWSDICIL